MFARLPAAALAAATAIVVATVIFATPSHACGVIDHSGMWSTPACDSAAPVRKYKRSKHARRTHQAQQVSWSGTYHAGPKPRKWCGWWMRTQFGGGPEYNVAWNWSRRGVAASPHVGAVVVWRHHVGYIVGMNAKGQWLVKSGNDSNAVRIRPRSLKGAVIRAL